jgi:glycosyltransferase involved in cell wall biosynthesis
MISVAFTNYNRTDLLFEAIEPFLADDRISEIVISDDHSTDDIYQTVLWKYNGVDKVKIFRNDTNIDCYRNKKRAVELCSNEWLLLLDSDNIFSTEFTDHIFSQNWMKNPEYRTVIFAPEFARPHFNFRELGGKLIDQTTVSGLLNVGNCSTMLNAMNYFVNRKQYLSVWDDKIDPVTSDSIYQNYRWLNAGNSIYVVQGLQYEHRVHDGSHYQKNVRRTPDGFHEDIMKRLKAMR